MITKLERDVMSESETTENTEEEITTKRSEQRTCENKQTNALLYLVLKEGYKLIFPKTKKENSYHKCITVESFDEHFDYEAITQLGIEFDAIVKKRMEKNGNVKEVTLDAKDLFEDGSGYVSEDNSNDVKKELENLPTPFE
ncbi:hypothetical protein EIN_340670 [Entamoeba invadens IP1]|uniref:Uncharacterized protein n=1 Tax=Entamoeba invadens IP1 TaxID=370355 RepID=A0A0A1UDQ8_ENTIV|nr:hypothetical protein EIN_340670 [Entamoeba invadens IP1]ELP94729.1 hypothetical protein EIN_340670 [Entamoeba invadens IP1]|eukprot:XP_004261500.1 hypothetical protein EIN_340670 [Entamoeba invadens IP1]